MNETTYLAFLQTAPGLEEVLAFECARLGAEARVKEGGVEARVTREELWRLCLASRISESVRVRLRPFVARDFGRLEVGVGKLPLRAFLPAGARVQLHITCHKSRLWHSGAVAERVTKVLTERAQLVVTDDAEDSVPLYIRLASDEVQVSVDAGGRRMHRRGYRLHAVAASVRETLAAASFDVVRAANEGVPLLHLVDPFAGAGTMALEALCFARGVLPGLNRKLSCEAWPTHDGAQFARLKEQLAGEGTLSAPQPKLTVTLGDSSECALDAAKKNAEAAGLLDACTFVLGDVQATLAGAPEGAWVLSNPPYGKRAHSDDAAAKLVTAARARADLRPVGLLLGGLAKKTLPPEYAALARTVNGGTNVSIRVLSHPAVAKGASPKG